PAPPSFPTRRSSDLQRTQRRPGRRGLPARRRLRGMLVAVSGPLHPPADRRGRRLSQGCVLMSRRGASEHLSAELSEPFGVDRTLASHHILGMRVDATSYGDATCRIVGWARGRESRYVCVASVNNVMQSYDAPAFRRLMNDADLVTPDGMPLVWGLRSLGARSASRV